MRARVICLRLFEIIHSVNQKYLTCAQKLSLFYTARDQKLKK